MSEEFLKPMDKMGKIGFATISALTLAGAAAAAPLTFEGDGVTWTVVDGGDGAPLNALHMRPGAANACPSHRVRLVPVDPATEGPPLTAGEKQWGDKRWRIVCVR